MQDNKKGGFTLIELLVGILVLGIVFSALGYSGLRDFTRRQRIFAAQRNMLSDLRAAQKDAASGRKPVGCTGILNGYLVQPASCSGSSCTQYSIYASCQGNPLILINTKTIENGVTLNSFSPVLFKSLSSGTNIPTGSNVNLVLTDPVNSMSIPIQILESGEIK